MVRYEYLPSKCLLHLSSLLRIGSSLVSVLPFWLVSRSFSLAGQGALFTEVVKVFGNNISLVGWSVFSSSSYFLGSI
jgi:hypothetical protein